MLRLLIATSLVIYASAVPAQSQAAKPTEDECIVTASEAHNVCSERHMTSTPTERLQCINRVNSVRELCKAGGATLQQILAAARG